MASNEKVADTDPPSAKSGGDPTTREASPPSTAESGKLVANQSEAEMVSDARQDGNNAAEADLRAIAPGSARKTGRPVGKEYVEHLLAHMEEQGKAISEQVRRVLQEDGVEDEGEKTNPDETPAGIQEGKLKESPEGGAQNGTLTSASEDKASQERGSLGDSDSLVPPSDSSAPSANVTGPPTLYLATTNPPDQVGSGIDEDGGDSTNNQTETNSKDGENDPDNPREDIQKVPEGSDEAPPLTCMVDRRVASLLASESESGTSQSENEGGDETGERKRRRGTRKRKKINGQVETAKNEGSQALGKNKSCPDDAMTKSTEHTDDGLKESVEESATGGEGTDAAPSVEGKNPDEKDAASQNKVVDIVEDSSKLENSNIPEGQVADKVSDAIPPMKQSVTVEPVKQNRPKRKIKHKFLESSDVYEHEPVRRGYRGRGRGRSMLSGIVVRRRGSRGRGGPRGRGTRGGVRGQGRGMRKMSTRGKGRNKWTHQKHRKVYPIVSGSGEPHPSMVAPEHITGEARQNSPAKDSPLSVVPRRGGFRGSRRRGSRRGYKNVANRNPSAHPKTDNDPDATQPVVVVNLNDPVLPVESAKSDSLPDDGGKNTPPTDKESSDVPKLPEGVELGEEPETVTSPSVQRFPIPFAGMRGKVKKSQKMKNNTHFGQRKMKRKMKRKMAELLDPKDPNEGPPPSKAKTNDSPSIGDTEEDTEVRTTHAGRMAPPSTIPMKSPVSRDHNYGLEPPLCCCKLVQDKPITAIADNCEGMEIVNGKVAVCTSKVLEAKVMRPSSRIPFRGLCQRHKKRMKDHKCCPGCGCFCTTGLTMICTIEGAGHHFHKECIREVGEALYCPHCGEDASLAKEISLPDLPELKKLTIMPESVLLSHQRVKLPAAFLESLMGLRGLELKEALEGVSEKLPLPRAKMTGKVGSPTRTVSPVMPETPPHQDESIFQLQLKTGRTLTSGLLPPGPSRESLEMAMKFMDPVNPRRLRFAPKNLYMASSLGEIEKVLQMLGEGFDPNYHFPAHNRETPVHAAAAKGHLDIVCMLFQAGANIDAEDEDHKTPLHLAVEKEQVECVKFLCKHGARPDHKDDDGMAAVHLATMKGNIDVLKFLLSKKTVLINIQDNGGWTPIIWAADNKNPDMVTYLLDQGADPNIRDKEQNIALHWAAYSGCEEVMEVLMNHCSFREALVTTVNLHGDTPLHVAARENNFGCVTQLLLRKADAKICNKEGKSPLDCCRPNTDVWLAIETNLRINIYAQKRNLRTERILSRDICRGRENVPIPVINSIDDEPLPNNFLYVSDNCETSRLDIDRNVKHMQGCLCDDDCSTESCPCGHSSVRCWYSLDGQLAEDFNYQEPPLLFECGTACHCWTTCRNRVVQNGVKAHLQLFRTARMGWGLRTTHDIPKGSFICQYAGELISDAEADKREDDSYLFDLENREGDVYCIDARFYGNISRFINHLCDPNIVPVRVFIEHWDLRFPHIAFFTSRDVKAFEELGFDYGDKFWSIKSKYFTCNCGSKLCKHAMVPEPPPSVPAKELEN